MTMWEGSIVYYEYLLRRGYSPALAALCCGMRFCQTLELFGEWYKLVQQTGNNRNTLASMIKAVFIVQRKGDNT